MKSVVALVSLLLFTYSNGRAQFKKGDVELSFFGTMGSWTSSYSGPNFSSSTTEKYLSINVTPGYYLADGLSVEPQLGLTWIERSKPSEYLLLNLSYTYLLPESRVGVFAAAGYGIGNSEQYPMTNVAVQVSDKFNVGVLNMGVGAKFLISKDVLIRTELNYRADSWTEEYSNPYYSISSDNKQSAISLLAGISILL